MLGRFERLKSTKNFVALIVLLQILLCLHLLSDEDNYIPVPPVPQVFIINLDKNPARWKRISYSAFKARLPVVTRIPAFEGATIETYTGVERNWIAKESLISARSQVRNHSYDHSYGSIGCSISHLRIWKKIVDENITVAVVLEDDVTIPKNFAYRLHHLLHVAPDDWEFLNIGPIWLRTPPGNITKRDGMTFFRQGNFWGTAAYVIKLETCKKFLESAIPVKYQVDYFIAKSSVSKYALKDPIIPFDTSTFENGDIRHTPANGEESRSEMLKKDQEFWAMIP